MATLPANIIPNATGRKGAAYYSNVSRIIMDSAARQSQLIAAQSSLAMQSVGSVVDSMSQAFQKSLDYSLAIKQADFARELQLRQVQIQEEDMELKRAQAHDMLLTRSLERKRLEMDNVQRERDLENEPFKRMSRAQLASVASEIESVATRLTTSPKEGDTQLLQELLESISNVKRQALMRGMDPSEASELTKNIAPLVRGLTTVRTGDGDEVGASTLINASPISSQWMAVVRDPSVGDHPVFASDSVLRAKLLATREILRDPRYSNPDTPVDSILPSLLKAAGIRQDDAGTVEVARQVLSDHRGQSREWQDEERFRYLAARDPERANEFRQRNPNATYSDGVRWLSGTRSPAPTVPRHPRWEGKNAEAFTLATASMDRSATGRMDGADAVRGVELGFTVDQMRAPNVMGMTTEAALRNPLARAGLTASRPVQVAAFKDLEDRVAYNIWRALEDRDVIGLGNLVDWINTELNPALRERFGPSDLGRISLKNYMDAMPSWAERTRTFSEPERTKFSEFVRGLPSADAPIIPPPMNPATPAAIGAVVTPSPLSK